MFIDFVYFVFSSTEHKAYDAKLYQKLIKSVNLPHMKLYLITKLVGYLDQHEIVLNPKSIYEKLKKLSRKRIDDNDNDVYDATNDIDSILNDTTETDLADYPFSKMMRKKYTSSISEPEYVRLLLDGLQAYADIHHIVEFGQRFAHKSVGIGKSKLDSRRFKIQKLTAFDERTVHKHVPALIAKQMVNAKNDRICTLSELKPDQSYTLNPFVHIFVDGEMLQRYRDDEKFYRIIMLDENRMLHRFLRR